MVGAAALAAGLSVAARSAAAFAAFFADDGCEYRCGRSVCRLWRTRRSSDFVGISRKRPGGRLGMSLLPSDYALIAQEAYVAKPDIGSSPGPSCAIVRDTAAGRVIAFPGMDSGGAWRASGRTRRSFSSSSSDHEPIFPLRIKSRSSSQPALPNASDQTGPFFLGLSAPR
jgi:hypothetical protein